MENMGPTFLYFSLAKILLQSYGNIEVVISDHSKNDSILEICKDFSKRGLDIKHFRNSEMVGNSSHNINFAINSATGEIIKILFQDDFLFHDNSISDIIIEFEKDPDLNWLVTSCCHSEDGSTFYNYMDPEFTENILDGNNRISSPSVLSFRKKTENLLFDPQFIWLMDCDYYYRMFEKFGLPFYLKKTNVVNRHWKGQLTKKVSEQLMKEEHELILKKHNYGKNF
jgi:glycosyltransferase involved in cell wall biosynthesis